MNALDVAYKVQRPRPARAFYPLSILYTIGLAAMVIVATGLLFIGPQAVEWLAGRVGLAGAVVWLWAWLRRRMRACACLAAGTPATSTPPAGLSRVPKRGTRHNRERCCRHLPPQEA